MHHVTPSLSGPSAWLSSLAIILSLSAALVARRFTTTKFNGIFPNYDLDFSTSIKIFGTHIVFSRDPGSSTDNIKLFTDNIFNNTINKYFVYTGDPCDNIFNTINKYFVFTC